MKIKAEQLIQDLIELTREHLNYVETLKLKSEKELNKKTSSESWSALECIEHLNRYGHFYLPEIKTRIDKSDTKSETVFNSGFLGNYFANSMMPKEKLNKMKTFKVMNPLNSHLDKNAIETFSGQLKEMLNLLNESRGISLNKVKTSISISKLIKLKLGDTFRVVIYHNERHLQQVKKVLDQTRS